MKNTYEYTVVSKNKNYKENAINTIEKICPSCNESDKIKILDPKIYGAYKQKHYMCEECGTEWYGNCYDEWDNPVSGKTVQKYVKKEAFKNFTKNHPGLIIGLSIVFIIITLCLIFNVPSKIEQAMQQSQIKNEQKQLTINNEYQEFVKNFKDVFTLNQYTVTVNDSVRVDEAIMAYSKLSDDAQSEAKEEKERLGVLADKIKTDIEKNNEKIHETQPTQIPIADDTTTEENVSSTTQENSTSNLNQEETIKNLTSELNIESSKALSKMSGMLMTAIKFLSALMMLTGLMNIVTGMMNEDAESKSRGILVIVTALIMMTLSIFIPTLLNNL